MKEYWDSGPWWRPLLWSLSVAAAVLGAYVFLIATLLTWGQKREVSAWETWAYDHECVVVLPRSYEGRVHYRCNDGREYVRLER